jgi:hypothetical protein
MKQFLHWNHVHHIYIKGWLVAQGKELWDLGKEPITGTCQLYNGIDGYKVSNAAF